MPRTPAQAHGRFPQITHLDAAPDGAGELTVTATFGLLTGDENGRFDWLCREVLGATETEDPIFVRMGDGSLLGATFHGLERSTDGGCSWQTPAGAPDGGIFIDISRDPSDPMVALAVTSAGGQTNTVYRTTDGGATFAPTGDPVAEVLFERVRVAPSDGSRIYLSGATPAAAGSARAIWIYRSDDGGIGFTAQPVAGYDGARNLRLLAVDPADPDHLWARVVRDETMAGSSDALVTSHDGGLTFETLLTMANLGGFALSADGSQAWVGAHPDDESGFTPSGPERGLWRSTDGGVTFLPVRDDLSVRCITAVGETLHVCADDSVDPFALGTSSDGGESFDPLLRLADIHGQVSCASDSPAATQCVDAWADLQGDLEIHSGGGGGGGCSVRTGDDMSAAPWLFGVLVLALRRWRQRSRSASAPARPH